MIKLRSSIASRMCSPKKKEAASSESGRSLRARKTFSPWLLKAGSGEEKRVEACSTWLKADSKASLGPIKLLRGELIQIEVWVKKSKKKSR